MTTNKSTYLRFVLCCAIFASVLLTSDVSAKTYSSRSHHSKRSTHHSSSHGSSGTHHSYPSSHGSSGTHHSYPSSHGSSGTHSYPSHSGGLSGNSVSVHHQSSQPKYPTYSAGQTSGSTSHSYPSAPSHSLSGGSSGGSHNYPPSPSLSGSGSRPSSVSYPSYPTNNNNGKVSTSGVHSYPSTNTLSGSGGRSGSGSGYPSNTGHGNTGTRYPSSFSNTNTVIHHTSSPQVHHVHHTNSRTVIHHHHHYDYSPPTVIHFRSSYHSSPVSYPVYTGIPPSYVYEYQSSGNRYSNLLSGLALYNLGRMSASSSSHQYHEHYIPQPDEYCKFGVVYKTGISEEMAIDCRAITYFIYESEPQPQTHITKNIVNQTTVTTQYMLPNGTLMSPANALAPMPVGTNMQSGFNAANALMPNTQQVFDSAGRIQTQQNTVNSDINNIRANMQQDFNIARTHMQAEMNAANALMPNTQQVFDSAGRIQPQQNAANSDINNIRANMQQDFNIARTNMQAEMNTANALMPNMQQVLNSVGQPMPNTQQINTVTTTTTQVVSVTDPRLSGKPVEVNQDMECYVSRTTRFTNMRKPVPCGLLQEYSASSLRRRSAGVMIKSSLTMIAVALAFLIY